MIKKLIHGNNGLTEMMVMIMFEKEITIDV